MRENALGLRPVALLALLFVTVLLFPFERGKAILHQAYLAEQKGEFRTAAQLYLQASHIVLWDRTGLRVKAAQSAARAEEHRLVILLLSPLQENGLLSYSAQILLAKAYLATGQLDAAVGLRQEWLEKGLSTEAIDPALLNAYLEQGEFESALPILHTLAAAQPRNPEWFYRLGLLLAAEQPQEAAPFLRRAAELDGSYQAKVSPLLEQLNRSSPEPVLRYLHSGRGLAALGEWKLAERAFEHAVQHRPDFAEAWAYLGLARSRLAPSRPNLPLHSQPRSGNNQSNALERERPGLAELHFALRLNPHSQVALAFLTLYWQEQGEAQLALHTAAQAFQLYPQDLNVRLQYAQALAQNGNLEGGWQVLSEWIAQSSDSFEARKALVLYCVQYGYRLSDSALPLAQALVARAPEDPQALDLLGQVHLGLENWTLAQQTFEQALRLDSHYAPAWLHLGLVYLEQGDVNSARIHFQRAVEIAPFSPSGEQAKRYLEIYLP